MTFMDLRSQGVEVTIVEDHKAGTIKMRFQKGQILHERTIPVNEFLSLRIKPAEFETFVCTAAERSLVW